MCEQSVRGDSMNYFQQKLYAIILCMALQPIACAVPQLSSLAKLKKNILSLYILGGSITSDSSLPKTLRKNSIYRRGGSRAYVSETASPQAAGSEIPDKPEIVQKFKWAVVGAGLAGIVAINFLVENKVNPASIAWIDPEFKVGAIGKYYRQVPGNLSTQQWIDSLEQCNYIKRCPCEPIKFLKKHERNSFYALDIIVQPLQRITDWLRTQMPNFKDSVVDMRKEPGGWRIELQNSNIEAEKVILATGSHPRVLDDGCKKMIDLQTVFDKRKLAQEIKPEDVVVVMGSSHSAVIALKFLSELPVKRIIHLYRRPFEYVVKTKKGMINVESGLKGPAAEYARTVLEDNLPSNMTRLLNTEETRHNIMQHCTKIIYAVGFEQNMLPWMQGKTIRYNDTSGVIDNNLYGFGIAFPEKKADAAGKIEYRVGLPFFIEYAKRVIPQWIR